MKNSVTKLAGMAMLAMAMATISVSCDSDDPTPTEQTFLLNRNDLKGAIENGQSVTLESGEYLLTGPLIVKDGGKLTINAGVKVTGTEFAAGQEVRYIAVAQGGQIFVNGTATNPVIMAGAVQEPGSWGGLVLCGRAPVNIGSSGVAEVSGLNYGGTDVNDNSGSITYLQILYSGYSYSSTKEFNGLSMFGVGKGTKIEFVQVHEGSDDGFEWFGGTVDSKYLVSTSNEDDQFDWTEGWNGSNEYWFAKQGLGRGNRGIEADNQEGNHNAQPVSSPTIKKMTLIGLASELPAENDAARAEQQGIKLRRGTFGIIDDVVISNWVTGIDIQHDETIAGIAQGKLKATNVRFDQVNEKIKGVSGTDLSAYLTENASATGAGSGTAVPDWAKGWTVGL